MKYYFLIIGFFIFNNLLAQSTIYNVELETYKGETIKMSSFRAYKILIATVNPDRLGQGSMAFLDSIQKKYPGVKVITVPISSSNDSTDNEKIRNLERSNKNGVVVSRARRVKKSDGVSQDKLMQWLTHVSDNTHFDLEVRTDEQLYFISSYGVLYAVVEKGWSRRLITELLEQEDLKL